MPKNTCQIQKVLYAIPSKVIADGPSLYLYWPCRETGHLLHFFLQQSRLPSMFGEPHFSERVGILMQLAFVRYCKFCSEKQSFKNPRKGIRDSTVVVPDTARFSSSAIYTHSVRRHAQGRSTFLMIRHPFAACTSFFELRRNWQKLVPPLSCHTLSLTSRDAA